METAAQELERGRRKPQYRTADEKRGIMDVFHWRKLYEAGMLRSSSDQPQGSRGVRLLPVTVEDEPTGIERRENKLAAASAGTINIALPGRALVSVEGSPGPAAVRAGIESLCG